jgi:hypothetical protein
MKSVYKVAVHKRNALAGRGVSTSEVKVMMRVIFNGTRYECLKFLAKYKCLSRDLHITVSQWEEMWLIEEQNLIHYAQFAQDRMKTVATCSLNASLLNNVGILYMNMELWRTWPHLPFVRVDFGDSS